MTAATFRAVLCVGVVALAACSALRLSYSQGPALTYWWLDGYADFSSEQAPRVKAALAQWFDWHRRTQLPDYASLLTRAQQEAPADVTPTQVCGWWTTLQARRDTALQAMAPAAAEIGVSLSGAQRAHIAAKFQRNNAKWRDDHLQPDPQRRERANIERAVDYAEKLYGRLPAAQRELLAAQVRAAPWQAEKALAHREAQQRDTLRSLQQLAQPGLTMPQAQALSRAWLTRLGQPVDEAARAEQQQQLRYWCEALATLHNRMEAPQRRHAVESLQGWQEDVGSFLAPVVGAP